MKSQMDEKLHRILNYNSDATRHGHVVYMTDLALWDDDDIKGVIVLLTAELDRRDAADESRGEP